MIPLLTLAALAAGALSIIFYTLRLGIGPVPTSPKVKRALMSLLPERVEGPILELGCGWGSLTGALARHYPQHQVIGYELSFLPYLIAKVRSFRHANLTIRRRDFFREDLDRAGLLVCYLFPDAMRRLDGVKAPLVTHTFGLSRKAELEAAASDLYRTRIQCYRTHSPRSTVSLGRVSTSR